SVAMVASMSVTASAGRFRTASGKLWIERIATPLGVAGLDRGRNALGRVRIDVDHEPHPCAPEGALDRARGARQRAERRNLPRPQQDLAAMAAAQARDRR